MLLGCCRGVQAVDHMVRDAALFGISQSAIQQLQNEYARFLIIHAARCWIKEIAYSRILQQKLAQPGQDVWQYLRNHINDVPAFHETWHVDRTALGAELVSLAATELKGQFCEMLKHREPWSVLYDK